MSPKPEASIAEMLVGYFDDEIGFELLDNLCVRARGEFMDLITQLIHDPFDSHSEQHMQNFFSYPTYAFLFHLLSVNPVLKRFFAENFAENSDELKAAQSELTDLGRQAYDSLKNISSGATIPNWSTKTKPIMSLK